MPLIGTTLMAVGGTMFYIGKTASTIEKKQTENSVTNTPTDKKETDGRAVLLKIILSLSVFLIGVTVADKMERDGGQVVLMIIDLLIIVYIWWPKKKA